MSTTNRINTVTHTCMRQPPTNICMHGWYAHVYLMVLNGCACECVYVWKKSYATEGAVRVENLLKGIKAMGGGLNVW